MAKICTQCGAELSDDIRFCTECGAPLPEGTAPQTENKPEEKKETVTVAAPAQPEPAPAPEPAPTPAPPPPPPVQTPPPRQTPPPQQPVYQQPVYQQPAYQPNPAKEETTLPGKPFGIVAMICGIVSLFLGLIGVAIAPPILGPAAIVFSCLAKNKASSVGKSNGMATVGLVLGIVSLAWWLTALIAFPQLYSEFMQGFAEGFAEGYYGGYYSPF